MIWRGRHEVYDDFPGHPPYISGRFYGWPSVSTSPDGFAIAADTLYALPFQIHYPHRFDQIAAFITTGAAGNAIVGIYQVAADGLPGDRLIQGDDILDTTTTGTTQTSTISQTLVPAWYYLALNVDANFVIGARAGAPLLGYFGRPTAEGSESVIVESDYTYDGVLPDPFDRTNLVFSGAIGSGTTLPSLALRAE